MKKKKIVAIYGVGLIGGSLGLALKGKGYYRIGIGRNPRKLALAKRRDAVDHATTDIKEGVREADIVVLAVPVELILPLLRAVVPWIKKSAVVTDAGSVKGCIMKGARRILPDRFVGSHPMAGSEKTGVPHARKTLFRKAGCVVVRGSSLPLFLQRIKRMWQDTGAKIIMMDARIHDRLVAICSHLPHVIAYALMHYMMHAARRNKQIIQMLAGSFRDSTRVAMSSSYLWSQIAFCNRMQLRNTVKEFNAMVKNIASAVNMPKKSLIIFDKAARQRKKLEKQFRSGSR